VIARKSSWQLQEAKNKLSEVVRRAREEGPQTITVRGEDAVVVVTAKMYEDMRQKLDPEGSAPKETLAEFILRWANRMEGIELKIPPRRAEPMRPGIFDNEIER
jgi:prevent-host-death family protein